jgi:antitoxin MazE
VRKRDSSAAVRIPAAVMQAVNPNVGETVDVREAAGRIVIEPVRRKVYNLDELCQALLEMSPCCVH